MVRALASRQCCSGSNPGFDAICGLSFLSVLSFASKSFSAGTPIFPAPQKPALPNSNSVRKGKQRTTIYIYSYFIYLLDCIFLYSLHPVKELYHLTRYTVEKLFFRTFDNACDSITKSSKEIFIQLSTN